MKKLLLKITSHALARDSFIVFCGTMGANIGSYLYHLIMGRMLGPAGYGELSSLLSIFYIFSVPLSLESTVLVKFISSMKAHNELGQVRTLVVKITKVCVLGSLIALPLMYIAAPYVSGFLHIRSDILFVIVYGIFAFSLLTIIATSALQGYQKFFFLSAFGAGAIILKLILSLPAVQWGVYGVLMATLIANIIMYVVYFLPLRFIFSVKAKPLTITARDTFSYAVPTLAIILGMTSLFSTDMILVRHFFPAYEAGLYASLAVLGKIIFYASSAVAIVLFPVLSERSAKKERSRNLIFIALGAVTSISMGITLLYFLFPGFIIRIFFSSSYIDAAPMLGLFGVFLVLYSVGNMLTSIFLALGKLRIWFIPLACAIIQIIGIYAYHGTVQSVIWVNIITSLLLVVSLLGYYIKRVYE